MFITFEGIDFCGKSTQVKLLKDSLINDNKRVKLIREPGGTHISEEIRDILLDKKNSGMYEETELLLFSASRTQLINEVIIPHLQKGYYVISDRFHDSLTAYQGYGRGLSMEFIKVLNKFVLKNAIPDLTFFIDISLEEVAKRKANMQLFEPDRIELSKNCFYEKVRNGYLELSEKEDRIFRIDGKNPIEVIHHQIMEKVNSFVK